MEKIKLSVISYLNTKPFLYGIEHSQYLKENSSIEMDFPSACAQKLREHRADIGIVPVALLAELENYFIVSDFCISTQRRMPSVLLSSQVPLNEIDNVLLDYQSMSSVNLAKILMKHYWKISPKITDAQAGYEDLISKKTAGVIIGDRALLLSQKFRYNYDLSDAWFQFTGLPFVFACWVSTQEINPLYINELNKALSFGLENIRAVVEIESQNINYQVIDIMKYLNHDLNFRLDVEKRKSIELYLNYLKKTAE